MDGMGGWCGWDGRMVWMGWADGVDETLMKRWTGEGAFIFYEQHVDTRYSPFYNQM